MMITRPVPVSSTSRISSHVVSHFTSPRFLWSE
jgi:hypothetical protein